MSKKYYKTNSILFLFLILTELPAPFSGYETIDALFPDRADVPAMGIPVNRDMRHEFFTRFRIEAFPAACDLFFLAAFPDPAERRTAPPSLHPLLHRNFTMAPSRS